MLKTNICNSKSILFAVLITTLLFSGCKQNISVLEPEAKTQETNQKQPSKTIEINGMSMAPNVSNGEHYNVDVSEETISKLQRGDIIVHQYGNFELVRRIIGLPGDSILLEGGQVIINGVKIDESPYLAANTKTEAGHALKAGETKTIPENKYFVLGDNRSASNDSRTTGLIDYSDIVGKLMDCYKDCETTNE